MILDKNFEFFHCLVSAKTNLEYCLVIFKIEKCLSTAIKIHLK